MRCVSLYPPWIVMQSFHNWLFLLSFTMYRNSGKVVPCCPCCHLKKSQLSSEKSRLSSEDKWIFVRHDSQSHEGTDPGQHFLYIRHGQDLLPLLVCRIEVMTFSGGSDDIWGQKWPFSEAFHNAFCRGNRSGNIEAGCTECDVGAGGIIITQNFSKQLQTKYFFDFRKAISNNYAIFQT